MDKIPLISLLHLADPSLPVGAYANSYGLETYVQEKLVYDADTTRNFAEAMLRFAIRYTDAALVSLAYQATTSCNCDHLAALHNLCHAVKIPMEIRQASERMGARLVKIFGRQGLAGLPSSYVDNLLKGGSPVHYPVIFGTYACGLNIPLADALAGFLYNTAAGIVTNAVKLIPLGQQQGQDLLFSLQPLIAELVTLCQQPDETLVGLSCAGFDIRSMQHEQLYSRLYMS